MQKIDEQLLRSVIAELPQVFDSHDVIRKIMSLDPRTYADKLGGTGGQDPIQYLHSEIGRDLARLPEIRKTRRLDSPNVRSGSTENQEWEKI